MLTIAITNHKGGVGKTATTHALGTALNSIYGRSVLLVDLDPQCSLSEACGVKDAARRSMAEVIGSIGPTYVNGRRFEMHDCIVSLNRGLNLAPADTALAASELALTVRLGRESVLKKALTNLGRSYDICLIDCPASLGLLTINALTAADALLIPTQANMTDLRSLRLFLDSVRHIQDELNPTLTTIGILVTFYENRLLHNQRTVEAMRTAHLPVLPFMVTRSIKVADAAAAGKSIITYAPDSPQSHAYKELAAAIENVLQREDDRWR